ncbi:D-glycero-beta-D-manno-heptose 1-phosphate adenylyltransferase [Flammeovirga kamogawensis]|uniref:D-glycero-beta-D-manno-heptose 1-phosphate adenylyltransferase n=1 Tax=Flammeovirga kamogawensis TaxID=373891 RepID=A0ABX8GVK8_9BACT|nr:D-glycero-beta-D-manno-heptose 1-phosphate adenylyltransferase [Flammeovirga kamogawensis]MBB6461634.1 rfaE bifunctional protein nucleotidyltransferase chain/domain [Flammeovirga kamogawensis]QWG07439.1 D-glycero-beta-D-manno-heptose 1-phosphate adenylyltransferase [Flammeovirga kamogawensis]TRX69250.1 D-glycero-beta-D-manno-heptose 1-phosphate adenylyltransferase [Flammeovirga kamogawensis]
MSSRASKDKILTLENAVNQRALWKENGEKVVFTNGCFDIVHLGHVDYLEQARNQGSKLILGLNTDASVKRLKGNERPINNEYARARLLAAFEFIDMVILFEDDTPLDLINSLLPDILVKGADYTVENIVGAKEVMNNGGKVETITLVEGFSTSSIIEKIRKFGL